MCIRDRYNEIRDLTTLQTGVIRIGIPPIIGTCVFPGLIDGFLQKYPGVELAIDQHGAKNIQERVYRGKLDLGLTIRPVMALSLIHIWSAIWPGWSFCRTPSTR